MKIEYNGEILDTIHYKEMPEEKFIELKKEYYAKPDFENVKKQMIAIAWGGTQNNFITDYYVKDLMAKTKIYYNKWTIEDVFNYKPLLEHFYGKVMANKNVYPDTMSDIDKIETAFRLGGKGIATKPANFPITTLDSILNKYNVNNNYYDFSCGWGARLTGALKHKVNYYGTDPNYLLTERLEQLAKDYKETMLQKTIVDIRTQGSEIYIPEWENKMGLAFSSPPYFYLEDYKIGDQSYKQGTSYQDWINNYLEPTFRNIYKYLIEDGYFILNINDFEKFTLVADSIRTAENNGFLLIGDHTLDNIKRVNELGEFNDNSERIMVFVKKKDNATIEDQKKAFKRDMEQLDIFDMLGGD